MILPTKLGEWLVNFIKDRKFNVKIEQTISEIYDINAGLGQGTVLSPILFSIFINDFTDITKIPTNKINNLLFADDLFAAVTDKNIRRLFMLIQGYLCKLEWWFNRWRLQISTHKCSYCLYSLGRVPILIKDNILNLKIFDEFLKVDFNPKYLGMLLDKRCSFNNHADKIKEKCKKSLNILNNLSGKNWSLDENSKLNIYKCLIRSKMEYAAPVLITSDYFKIAMNGIQYKSLRTIYKQPPRCSSTMLHKKAKIATVEQRINYLAKSYLDKAVKNNNPLIKNSRRSHKLYW